MDNDEKLRRLGRAAPEREEPRSDHLAADQLQALSRGELGAEQAEPLERHLASCDLCLDRAVGLGMSSPRLSERRVQQILAATTPSPRVSPWLSWVGAPAALAFALMLWFLRPTPPTPLGGWELSLSGQAATVRGEEAGESFRPGSELRVQLAPPGVAPAAAPEVSLFLRPPGGEWRKVAPRVQWDEPSGLVTLSVLAGEVMGDRYGRWDVAVVVLPPGEQLDQDEPPGEDVSGVLRGTLTYERDPSAP